MQDHLAAQNSEEVQHQVEFDFVPEPSSQGLVWKLSESRFGSLLCDMNLMQHIPVTDRLVSLSHFRTKDRQPPVVEGHAV